MGVTCSQGTLSPPDTWFCPFGDLHICIIFSLKAVFPNLWFSGIFNSSIPRPFLDFTSYFYVYLDISSRFEFLLIYFFLFRCPYGTYLQPATHLLLYVRPSSPHTGWYKAGHVQDDLHGHSPLQAIFTFLRKNNFKSCTLWHAWTDIVRHEKLWIKLIKSYFLSVVHIKMHHNMHLCISNPDAAILYTQHFISSVTIKR